MKQVLSLLACALVLSACSEFRGMYIVDAASIRDGNTTKAAQQGKEAAPPIDLSTYCFPEDLEPVKTTDTAAQKAARTCASIAYNKAASSTNPKAAQLARNKLTLDIMSNSEDICSFHKGAIMANSAGMDFSTGFLSSVLSTLSTAFTPATTVTALSAGSAITSAAGTGLRANVYQNLLTAAIVTEIENKRKAMRKQILARQGEPVETYTISEALYEVERYHEKCSFYVGVAELAKDRTPKARTKEDIQKEIAQLRAALKEINDMSMSTNFTDVGDQGRKAQYKLYNDRILNLIRLQEIAPGENMVSIPEPAFDAARTARNATDGHAYILEILRKVEAANDSVLKDHYIITNAVNKAGADTDVKDKVKELISSNKAESAAKAAIIAVSESVTVVKAHVYTAKTKAAEAASYAGAAIAPGSEDEIRLAEARLRIAADEVQAAVNDAKAQTSTAIAAAKTVNDLAAKVLKLVPKAAEGYSKGAPVEHVEEKPLT